MSHSRAIRPLLSGRTAILAVFLFALTLLPPPQTTTINSAEDESPAWDNPIEKADYTPIQEEIKNAFASFEQTKTALQQSLSPKIQIAYAAACSDSDQGNTIAEGTPISSGEYNLSQRGTCSESGVVQGTDFCLANGITIIEYACESTRDECFSHTAFCPASMACKNGICTDCVNDAPCLLLAPDQICDVTNSCRACEPGTSLGIPCSSDAACGAGNICDSSGVCRDCSPPPICTLSASPNSITQGSSSTLNWSVSGTNVTSCAISGGLSWNQSFSPPTPSRTGTIAITTPASGTYTYNLTCTDTRGLTCTGDTATLTVTPAAACTEIPNDGLDPLVDSTCAVGGAVQPDTCSGGTRVLEYQCAGSPAICASSLITCPAGTECLAGNGRCTPVSGACTESPPDGTDPLVGSVCTSGGTTNPDTCSGGTRVLEYQCTGSPAICASSLITCPAGTECLAGNNRCTPVGGGGGSCNDTDGDNGISFPSANFSTRGTCTDSIGSAASGEADFCNASGVLQEHYCSTSNICSIGGQVCPAGTTCSSGACVTSGGGICSKTGGICKDGSLGSPYPDTCVAGFLEEYICVSGSCTISPVGMVPCVAPVGDTGGGTGGGLLPACGDISTPCTFCHFLQLLSNIVNFAIFMLAPLLAILMTSIGGFIMIVSRGNPGQFNKGKSYIAWAFLGYALVLLSWVIVNIVLTFLGVASWVGVGNWWQLTC